VCKSVLVVDDDRAAVHALSKLLKDEGYAVTERFNGEEAWDYLSSTSAPPCLILLDLIMPVMDGREFRRHQVADAALSNIPVVLMTVVPPGPDQELSDVPVLKKPIVLEELLDTVVANCGPLTATHEAVRHQRPTETEPIAARSPRRR
jgi:CheY-like chemotaxis protein